MGRSRVSITREEVETRLARERRGLGGGTFQADQQRRGRIQVWEEILARMDRALAERQKELGEIRRQLPGDVRAILRETDAPKYRHDDPVSSVRSALETYESGRQLNNKVRLYYAAVAFHRAGQRFTAHTLSYTIGSKPHKTSTQVTDLKDAGLLRETGRTMRTRDGGEGMVLEVAVLPDGGETEQTQLRMVP